jgi:hypothetical protein
VLVKNIKKAQLFFLALVGVPEALLFFFALVLPQLAD